MFAYYPKRKFGNSFAGVPIEYERVASTSRIRFVIASGCQFERSGTTFFGSDVRNNTIQTPRRTRSLNKNSPARFHAIGSADRLHLTTPGVDNKNDHVIANVPIPIKEPSAD